MTEDVQKVFNAMLAGRTIESIKIDADNNNELVIYMTDGTYLQIGGSDQLALHIIYNRSPREIDEIMWKIRYEPYR